MTTLIAMPTFAISPAMTVAVDAPTRWSRIGASLRNSIQLAGQLRARRQLLALARGCEASQPGLARELRSASNQMLNG